MFSLIAIISMIPNIQSLLKSNCFGYNWCGNGYFAENNNMEAVNDSLKQGLGSSLVQNAISRLQYIKDFIYFEGISPVKDSISRSDLYIKSICHYINEWFNPLFHISSQKWIMRIHRRKIKSCTYLIDIFNISQIIFILV